MPPVLSSNIQTVQSRNLTEVPTLHARALIDPSADSTTRTLIIVGITCGTIAAVVLVGIFVYLVVRHRRLNDTYGRTRQYRHSVPASSRIRNGYTRSRAESNSTMNSRKTTSTRDQPQGYFKSWSSRTKTAYLSLPVPGVVQLTNSPPERIQLGGYQYDPALPKREKPKKKKSMRERLRLDTNIIAPSPRLDLNADPNRQSTLLMKSATSPPPFAQYFPNSAPSPNRNSNTVGQHIRPRAELKVGETPSPRPRGGAAGQAGLGSFVPPPPPSWASFWPTESGWTGPGGDPSIRDEDFGSDSDESWSSDKKPHLDSDDEDTPSLARKRKLDDENGEEGQYATDNREYAVGPFRLTPRDLQGNGDGRGSLDVESVSSRGTVSPEPGHLSLSIPPETAEPMLASPRVDLLEDYTQSAAGSSDRLERTTTGKLTLAFGRRSNTVATKSSGKSRRTNHSRNGSSVSGVSSRPSRPSRSNTTKTGLTRSSTTRTDRTDYTEQTMSPMSTVSGQILAALTGHVATPLLRSVSSLGRSRDETQDASASQARVPRPVSMPVRRLPTIPISVPPVPAIPPVPALPSSVSIPPVPPIPRRHVEPPRPLPIPVPTPVPVPRSMSLNLPPSRSPAQVRAAPPCSPPIRPLPLPPVPS